MKIPLCKSPDCFLELRASVAADPLQPGCEDLTKGQGPRCPNPSQGPICACCCLASQFASQSWGGVYVCVCTGFCTLVTIQPEELRPTETKAACPLEIALR